MLGPFEVASGDSQVRVGGPRPQRLLLRLAIDVGTPVSRDSLVEAVWGDQLPDDPSRALRTLLSRLRTNLGEGVVATRPSGVLLTAEEDRTDVLRFDRLASEGSRFQTQNQPAKASQLYEEALRLWRGPVGAPHEDAPFLTAETGRLQELRTSVSDRWLSSLVEAGEFDRACAEAERLLVDDPYHDRIWASLMLALYRLGRQADALNAYRRHETQLREDLGLEPSPLLQRLELQILDHDPALEPITPRSSVQQAVSEPDVDQPTDTPLPRTGDILGRDEEINQILSALEENRLMTLVGPGGIGKTTTAIGAARMYTSGRAWFVDLSQLQSSGEVRPQLSASVLGTDDGDMEELGRALSRNRGSLLILDNCEDFVEEVGETVGQLLNHSATLKVLATSRIPLGLRDEQVLRLGGLLSPDPATITTTDDLLRFPATSLILRSAGTKEGDQLSDRDVAALARVVRYLDGLPLGLEMAGGLLEVLSPAQLEERIDTGITELRSSRRDIPERHRTLQAAVTSASDALDAPTRQVLHAAAVTSGKFSVEVIEWMQPDIDVPPALAVLKRRGLIRDTDQPARFALPPFVRDRIRSSLAPDDRRMLERRHTSYYSHLIAELHETEGDSAGQRLRGDEDNLILAIRNGMSATDGLAEAARMYQESMHHFELVGRLATLSDLTAEILAIADETEDDSIRLYLLGGASWVVDYTQTAAEGLPIAHERLDLARRLGEPLDVVRALVDLGVLLSRLGNMAEANKLHEEARSISGSEGLTRGLMATALNLGHNAILAGNTSGAIEWFAECDDLSRQLQEADFTVAAILGTAEAMTVAGDDHTAIREKLRAARSLSEDIEYPRGVVEANAGVGWIDYLDGDLEAARELLTESLATFADDGDTELAVLVCGRLAHVEWAMGRKWEGTVLLERERQVTPTCQDIKTHREIMEDRAYDDAVVSARRRLPTSLRARATLALFEELNTDRT